METPHEMTFLIVLRQLLQIDASDVIGDVIWETVEKLVASATVLNGQRSDAERLLADGARRLSKAVAGPRRRSDRRCSGTCQCVCHDDLPKLNSSSSDVLSPTTRSSRPSDSGSYLAQHRKVVISLSVSPCAETL